MNPPKVTCRPFCPSYWQSTIKTEQAELLRMGVVVPSKPDWVWSRMLVISKLRRSKQSFPAISAKMNTSASRCRSTFDSFLKRTGLKRDDYPRYCR